MSLGWIGVLRYATQHVTEKTNTWINPCHLVLNQMYLTITLQPRPWQTTQIMIFITHKWLKTEPIIMLLMMTLLRIQLKYWAKGLCFTTSPPSENSILGFQTENEQHNWKSEKLESWAHLELSFRENKMGKHSLVLSPCSHVASWMPFTWPMYI